MSDRISGFYESRGQCREVFHDEGRVGLSRRCEILLDPEMNLQFAVFKPAATSRSEICGLHRLRDSENLLIEFPCIALSAGRHCEQDMIQSANAHHFTFLKAD